MKLVKAYQLYFINTDIVENVSFTVIPDLTSLKNNKTIV